MKNDKLSTNVSHAMLKYIVPDLKCKFNLMFCVWSGPSSLKKYFVMV